MSIVIEGEPATDRAIANGLAASINSRIISLGWLVEKYRGDGSYESTRIANAYEGVMEWLKVDVAMYRQELDEREGEE